MLIYVDCYYTQKRKLNCFQQVSVYMSLALLLLYGLDEAIGPVAVEFTYLVEPREMYKI